MHDSQLRSRFITSIETYYSSLAITRLFERHTELEDYLKEREDDALLSAVRS